MKYPNWAPDELCLLHKKQNTKIVIRNSDGGRRVLENTRPDNSILERLITDPKMEIVWGELRKNIHKEKNKPYQHIYHMAKLSYRQAQRPFETAATTKGRLKNIETSSFELAKELENLPEEEWLVEDLLFELYPDIEIEDINLPQVQLSDFLFQLSEYAGKRKKEHRNRYVTQPTNKNAKKVFFVRKMNDALTRITTTPLSTPSFLILVNLIFDDQVTYDNVKYWLGR